MLPNKRLITNRAKQWGKYNAWEATSQRITGEPDLTKTFQWYSSAWEMAQAHNPAWSRQKVDQEKVRRLQKIREALALIGETYEHP